MEEGFVIRLVQMEETSDRACKRRLVASRPD